MRLSLSVFGFFLAEPTLKLKDIQSTTILHREIVPVERMESENIWQKTNEDKL